jgi:hypothetical protein
VIQTGGKILHFEIHSLHSIQNKEELPQQWQDSITVPIYKMEDKTDDN